MTQELNETIDNGETEVQITTIGDVVGTNAKGEAVVQHFTEDALKNLAEKHKDDELLVDCDHESETGGSTSAKGWLSGLKFIPGTGLFGKIKWTDIGRKLIENRVFRWLSPSFRLDSEKRPVLMTSVALTNKPAQAGMIDPIVNSQPINFLKDSTTEEIQMTMTKEELVSLIKETVSALNSAPEKNVEEVVEVNDDTDKVVEDTDEVVAETTDEVVAENVCSEDETASNEVAETTETETVADAAEEVVEEVVETTDKSDDDTNEDDEVIKIETLNSQPKTEGIDIVKNFAPTQTPAKGYAITTIVR